MDPIYQLSQEEEKLSLQYLDTMIKEGEIGQSNSTVRREILFVPNLNGCGL
jgi:hypothetical protein